MRKRITIEFEDHVQDFLAWDIETTDSTGLLGRVVESRPCQSWVWVDMYVLNLPLEVGGKVQVSHSPQEAVICIKYPIVSVEEKEVAS
jgi:hypothetical protein